MDKIDGLQILPNVLATLTGSDPFDIEARHPEYNNFLTSWTVMRDTYDGEESVKEKGETYLPMKTGVRAITNIDDRKQVYNDYKFRAEFPEIVAPTIRGSLGLVHAKNSSYKLPAQLDYLVKQCTKTGLTLSFLNNKVTEEILLMGRVGLLATIDDDSGEFYIALYPAERIINWDMDDGRLTWLVLDETRVKRNPATNKWVSVEEYLALQINDAGFFTYTTYTYTGRKDKNNKKIFTRSEEKMATSKGRPLDYIPFVFGGSMDTEPSPNDIPMYGLARLALRAYRLDADYVNSLHFTSEPTPYVTGVDKNSAPDAIGAGNLWILPGENATAGMLEFSGPGLEAQDRAISATFQRALMFGAQMFSDTRKNSESGEAMKTRFTSQTSTLKMIAESSALTIKTALRYIARWAGIDEAGVEVKPNLDFFDHQLNHQEILAIVSGWQSGAYSKQTMFENLQRGGIIDPGKKFDEEEAMIDPRILENMLKIESAQSQNNSNQGGNTQGQ